MEGPRFETSEIRNFFARLSLARKPSDLLIARKLLGKDPYGIGAMVSFPIYEADSGFTVLRIPSLLSSNYIVPYLRHKYIYFIDNEVLLRPWKRIDYTVTFDTNCASYIKAIVRGESLKGQPVEVMQVIDDLLCNNVNFDLSFYWLENIKVAYPTALRLKAREAISPLKFWKSLDKNFRRNIVSLELFKGVDCEHYRKTRTFKFDISFMEAVRNSINFTFTFYASPEGQELIRELLLPMQRVILLQLIAMLRIQFFSKQGAKNKIGKFLGFVQNNVGAYFDRETIIAYKYFKDRNAISFLETVNKGGRQTGLLKKIDNLAWDMTAARFMEKMIGWGGQGDYLIPFFLSFDKKLRDLIGCYSVKAVIIDRKTRSVVSIPEPSSNAYFMKEGCGEIIASFFPEDKKRERWSKINHGPEILLRKISSEYRELHAILLRSDGQTS